MTDKNFSITKTIKNEPFISLFIERNERLISLIKNSILGKNYSLSIVFIGEKRSQTLNKQYRNKDKPTDILSFPLSGNEGEIFINLNRTKTESKKFGRSYENFILFLLIHGFCHLKGMTHGSRMESKERKYRKIFKI